MTDRRDRIRIHIEGKEYSVVGGEFRDMLAAVKQINGRRFIGELKVWQLPGSLDDVRHQLEISGYQLEGGLPVEVDAASLQQSGQPDSMGDRIRVQIGPHRLAVVGGSFQDMLAAVKALPGRRFDGETKIWEIPGDVGVIKGMIETAGFQLEGADKISLDPAPPMEAPDFGGESSPPPFEPPDFLDDDDIPPYEPPDWWDDMPPPSFEDSDEPDELLFPSEPESPQSIPVATEAAASGDRIRVRLGDLSLVVTGGSFQEMLAAVKEIPGRRFDPAEKIWQIPEDITLDSVQQSLNAAGFILMQE